MKVEDFIKKLQFVCDECKTLYVMGCFGAPLNKTNKKRYKTNHVYNTSAVRQNMIEKATVDTFGFDCVNLIKGIMWGFVGDKTKTYGGAKYATNNVPDVSADGMIGICKEVKTNGWDNIVPGEAVWTKRHIGVYIGDGKVIECSPKWSNNVQYSNLGNIKKYKTGHYRVWTKHGKFPFIEYNTNNKVNTSNINLEEIAKQVIAGKYGNGTTRKNNLKKAGYSDDEIKNIQNTVNKLLKK